MPHSARIGYQQMLEVAEREIRTISATDAIAMAGGDDVVIVDLREIRELEREGRIPGSFHAPRGMLEFWIDPDSPFHKPLFGEGKKLVFHCASGWRSALATQTAQRMGLKRVCHIGGGLKAWREAGGPLEPKSP